LLTINIEEVGRLRIRFVRFEHPSKCQRWSKFWGTRKKYTLFITAVIQFRIISVTNFKIVVRKQGTIDEYRRRRSAAFLFFGSGGRQYAY
jgi:hypothetical protein